MRAWARWPKSRLQLAHDVLVRASAIDPDASVTLAGVGPLWRAHLRDWSFTGSFEEAAAQLALQVFERGGRARDATRLLSPRAP